MCTSVGFFFLKNANYYDNFNCYTLGNAKLVLSTSDVHVGMDGGTEKVDVSRRYIHRW